MGVTRSIRRLLVPVLAVAVGAVALGSSSAHGEITPAAVAQPAVLSPPDVIVGEADGVIELEVRLLDEGLDEVTVQYEATPRSAVFGPDCNADFVQRFGTLAFAPGEVSKIVSVEIHDCSDVERLESFQLRLLSVFNGTFARASTRVGIVDNDTEVATPNLFVRDTVVDEKDGTALVSVLLGGPGGGFTDHPVEVDYETSNGTAAAGSDYTSNSGSLTFGVGETAKTVLVPIADDAVLEPAESFTLDLSAPDGAIIADGSGSISIGPSDATPVAEPIVSPPAHVVVGEHDGFVDFAVTLSAPSPDTVSVFGQTARVTAGFGTECDAGVDFLNTNLGLNFAPGETTKVVSVEVFDCPDVEGFESFFFRHDDPFNAALAQHETRVGIVDNDTVVAAPRLVVRDAVVDEKDGTALVSVLLGGAGGQASNGTVSVGYQTTNGSASAGSDYTAALGTLTFAPGETAKTVVIPIADDAVLEPFETLTLDLSGVSGATISDGSGSVSIGASDAGASPAPLVSAPPPLVVGEADGFVDMVVTLSSPSVELEVVSANVVGLDAIDNLDCNADFSGGGRLLRFAPGETTKVLRSDIRDCPSVEGLESFVLDLRNPHTVGVGRPVGRVGIVDNDTVVAAPRLVVRDAVVDEKDGTALVSVLLGGAGGQASNGTVSVGYQTTNGSASAGSDYTAALGTLTFAPGETAKTVVIPIADDAVLEPFETLTLDLSGVSGATIADGSGSVSIGASDAPAVAVPGVLAPADMIVGEGDGFLDLVVRLSEPGIDPVAIFYTTGWRSANGAIPCGDFVHAGRFADGTLTFAPGQTTQVVRVDITDCPEADVERLESFFFFLDADPALVMPARTDTQIGIVDNDTVVATPKLVVRDAVVDEKDGFARVAVLLGGPRGEASASSVTVGYQTLNGTASSGADYSEQSGTLTFAPGETAKTVLVPIADDADVEPAESLTLSLSVPSGAMIQDGTGAISIGPNDAAAVAEPALSIADATAAEDDGYVDVLVSLSQPGQSPVTVAFATLDGTAEFGTECDFDYEDMFWVFQFAPGETTKSLRVHLLDCDGAEPLEFFDIELFFVENATVANDFGVVSITDDEVFNLTGITVTPAATSLGAGTNRQFTATGNYSNAPPANLTSTVTWSSSNPGVATIAAGGLARGVSPGSTSIIATLGPISGSTALTVTPAALLSIAITPANPTLAVGDSQQFAATGTFADGSTRDITSGVTWTSLTPSAAAITVNGLALAIASGTTTIRARSATRVAETTLTVTPAPPEDPPPTPPKKCKVPKLVGKRLAAAKHALKRGLCRTGKVTRAYSGKVKTGRVVSQSRRAGRVLPLNSKVNLVVSRGPRPSR